MLDLENSGGPERLEDSEGPERTERPTIKNRIVIYLRKPLSKRAKKWFKWIGISFLILAVLCFLLVFVVFPVVFMMSIKLQQLFMFTNLNLATEKSYFSKYEIQPGIRNLYVTVKDKSGALISLGVWHLLPYIFEHKLLTEEEFDFDSALHNENTSVLLYFHGTGEDRSNSYSKYTVFRYFFHVITFDYRNIVEAGYGDSGEGELSENAVIEDCMQLYEWLANKTSLPIFIWGHSLGSALATRTAAQLSSIPQLTQPLGLILEAPFTKMSEELYKHPISKMFAWLPWFEATVIKPLEKNGFVFDTSKHILKIDYPIMILNSEDDNIVPYYMGKKLYEIAIHRMINNITLYYRFPDELEYKHNFIYLDQNLPYFINYFYIISLRASTERNGRNLTELE